MSLKITQAVAGLLLFSGLAVADQTSSNEEPADLSTLLVTAGISPIEADQFGGSVTVITADDLEAMKATYLADALRLVPGFAINQSGGPGTQTQLRVRGSEANHVLVLRDGVRVNDPTAGDEFLFNYAMTEGVERIEIIRGPQSAVWGSDALSAVINIITKKSDQTSGRVQLELGSFNTKSLSASGTLAEDAWHLNAGIQALDSAGTNISRVGPEADGFENMQTRIDWGIALNDAFDLGVNVNHQSARNEFDGTDFVVTGLPQDADLWTDRDQTTADINVAHQPNERWQNQFSYSWVKTDASNHAHGVGETSSTDSETKTLALKSAVKLGAALNHRLSFAAEHRDTEFQQTGVASPFGDPNQTQSYDLTGIALEYNHQVNQAFSWNASFRHDDYSEFDDVSNHKVAFSYQFSNDWRFRGSYGSGSKAPSFIERFGFFPANFLGNLNLKPEESDAFELAVHKQWDGYNLELIYFDQDLDNEINGFVFDADSGLFTAANQAGTSKRHGFEINWFAQISQDLNLTANYTHTKATEPDAAGVEVDEVRRPENMGHVRLDYQFASDRARLNVQLNHVGDQLDLFFDPATFASSRERLDAYTTVDLALNYDFNRNFSVYLKAQNLFDETHEEVLGYARPGAGYFVGVTSQF